MNLLLPAMLAAAGAQPADPVGIFVGACMNGEIRLPAKGSEVRMQTIGGVPTKIIRVAASGTELRIAVHPDPKQSGIERTCAVRASNVKFMDVVRMVQTRTIGWADGLPHPDQTKLYSKYVPAGGYRINVLRDGSKVEMQTILYEASFAALELARVQSQAMSKTKQ